MIGYENGRAHILVAASLPANSYAVYDVRTGGSEKTISPSAASAIENSVYKITLDKNGDIISLTDKRNNKELVKDGKATYCRHSLPKTSRTHGLHGKS